jgi:cell division protein FtsI (penicillin-binding protein 3)
MSSKLNNQNIMPRYSIIAIVMTLLAVAIVVKTVYIMTAKRQYWTAVAARLKVDSVQVKPTRGNIYSSDGQLMASSLPEFKIFMDFNALHEAGNDSLWEVKLDSICMGLNQIFTSRKPEEFRKRLEEGRQKQSRHWAIWERRIDYSTYKEVMQLPVFNLSKYKSGFHSEEFNARRRPFTSLAQRTIGDMFGAKDTARCGLELSYDSILRGKNGIIHRRKILNKYLSITDKAPVDGMDIVTTIDVGMQDLAERAVIDELKEINGNVGVAIVMEVATGDIKAIVNMEKCYNADGEIFYAEAKNHAVSDLLEPGSVFKTASIMVALDDGVCDTNYVVETGGGVWNMYGRDMKDHNWRRGGYGTMRLPKSLEVSSNIGVSRIIDHFYHDHPEKYVQGLYDLGLNCDLDIPIPGYSPAKVRMPKKDSRGKQYLNWSKTALPWMSIGYETQVPPISTLTFYNAIANGGKMMKPRFVKEVLKDGEVYMEFPPEVVKGHAQIAKPSTIATIQTILEHVVSQGLGKKAGSPSFKVAGKTGTAQIWTSGGKTSSYLLSFAGYFPADKPRYSCIVCIQKDGLPASGGGMSGVVFHHISEGIMAQSLKLDVNDARDTSSVLIPEVKNGNLLAADYVLNHLGFNVSNGWAGAHPFGRPIWGIVNNDRKRTLSLVKTQQQQGRSVPDVKGMGARDAVYIMESRGIKVIVEGRGKVVEQSIPAGNTIKKGDICKLKLA